MIMNNKKQTIGIPVCWIYKYQFNPIIGILDEHIDDDFPLQWIRNAWPNDHMIYAVVSR